MASRLDRGSGRSAA